MWRDDVERIKKTHFCQCCSPQNSVKKNMWQCSFSNVVKSKINSYLIKSDDVSSLCEVCVSVVPQIYLLML